MRLINLIPLKEIDFPNQKAFDTYNQKHQLRPDTKVTIAGKTTTAGKAAQKSAPVKGTSVFGKSKKSGDDLGGVQWDNSKKDEEKYDSKKIGNFLNKVIGSDKGYAQSNDNGGIMYNIDNGEWPTYTLYVGDDEAEKGKIAVEILPTYGNDPANLNVHKTFDNMQAAMKHAAMLAKKHKKELEMQDPN